MEIVSAILALVFLILLALLYFFFKKGKEEQQRLNHEIQTIRYEFTTRVVQLELAHYQQLPGSETIRYDLAVGNAQEDFTGKGAASWDYIHHRFDNGIGTGSHELSNNFLQVSRTNKKGRYELHLKKYFFESATDRIPADITLSNRYLRITGEAKRNGPSPVLRFVFKGESQNVLDEKDLVVFSPEWEPIDMVFTISATEACYLRIDHLTSYETPGSVQLRNLKLLEKR